MNAKTCKRLRRAAESASVGLPARRLIAIGQRTNKVLGPKGKERKYAPEGAVNDPHSTRGIYRAMKKAAR